MRLGDGPISRKEKQPRKRREPALFTIHLTIRSAPVEEAVLSLAVRITSPGVVSRIPSKPARSGPRDISHLSSTMIVVNRRAC